MFIPEFIIILISRTKIFSNAAFDRISKYSLILKFRFPFSTNQKYNPNQSQSAWVCVYDLSMSIFFLIWQRYSAQFYDPCMKTPSIFIDLSWVRCHLQDRWTTCSQDSMFPSSLIHLAFQIQACSKYEKHCVNAVHYGKPLRQVKHDNSRG